jgi:AraC-like DNA-binding protein
VRHAQSLADFLSRPNGAGHVGDHFDFYNLGTVCGWRVWGRPTREDAQALTRCIATAYAPAGPRYFSLVDLREVESVEPAAFEVLLKFVSGLRDQMRGRLVRQALVRPQGLVGVLAEGFYVMLQAKHPVKVFDTVAAAARWLKPADPAPLLQLVEIFERPRASSLEVQLRRWLVTRPKATPAEAARALGVSLRTLQRRLTERGASFQQQLRLVRVQHAERLLTGSELKISAVAQEAGFATSQQLATAFKAVVRLTPSQFRARYRRL